MSRYLTALSLGLCLLLLVGCAPPTTSPPPAATPAPADSPHGVHVDAPGVNVDVHKNDPGDKRPNVNVDVKPRQ